MPTIAGMRRRGYPPEAIRNFCDRIGVAKNDSIVDIALLEHCVRDTLNEMAPRVMGVLRPLRMVIDNYPENRMEELESPCHPKRPERGFRKVPFSRVLYIEQEDFLDNPPKKYNRLAPGREVRLRNAYIVKCVSMVKDEKTGELQEIHCTYDPGTLTGSPEDGRKVEGTIHWVSAAHSLPTEIRLYDRLFSVPNPMGEKEDFTKNLNRRSMEVLVTGRVEPSLKDAAPGSRYQFERIGYFCVDPDSSSGKPIFNRIATLRDSWAKVAGQGKK
jgi:glutaminyl-tRNA synthetase